MVHTKKTLLAGLGVLAITASLVSFSEDKGKKKYEVIHHSGGKTVTYDTLIPMNSKYTVEAFLADKGIQNENIQIVKIPNGNTKMMFIEKDGNHAKSNVEFIEENVEINVEIDDNGNKTITKTVNGQEVELTPEELEEIENNEGNGQVHIIEIEEGGNFEFLGDLPEGSDIVEIRAEIDDNGNFTAKKFVNGEEVEPTAEELKKIQSHEHGGNHIIEINEDDPQEGERIIISKTISREETNDGENTKTVENHDVNWTSDDPNAEFTIVLVTEDYVAEEKSAKKETTVKNKNTAFKVYPNPNNGHFTLTLEQGEKLKTTISIADAQGKTVFEENLGKFSGNYSKEIDLKKFGIGTYIITIVQGNEQHVQKIIIQE